MRRLEKNSYRHKSRIRDRLYKKLIGEGFYSSVFQHPNDPAKAVKVGPLDDGWLAWAMYVNIERRNGRHPAAIPHLPVVHSIRRYEKHGIYVAVMEKLEGTYNSRHGDEDRNNWCDVRTWFSDQRRKSSAALDTIGWGHLIPFLRELATFARENSMDRDLHGENVMYRADGVLVITDPFSGNGERASAKLLEVA